MLGFSFDSLPQCLGPVHGRAAACIRALITRCLRSQHTVSLMHKARTTKENEEEEKNHLQAYIGPPGLSARYDILRSCVLELQRAGVVASGAAPPPWSSLSELDVAASGLQVCCM